ncbi:MAG TPA: hypothetical protein VF035_09150 [Longimicrobiales bacterium]
MPQRPDPTPFAPEIGAQSPVLEALVRGPSAALSAVLLVAGERARSTGFAPAAAMAIADAWSAASRTPVLVDLGFEAPSLHTHVGGDNDEGIADAFAFGTSINRLARPAAGRSFSLLPSGLALDPAEIRASTDWRRLIAQEGAAGHTLLLYVPAGAPGVDALAQKVGAVIVLAEPEEVEATAASLERQFAIVAVFHPASTGRGPDDAAAAAVAPGHRRPPLIVDDATEADRAEAGLSGIHAPPDVPAAPPTVLDTAAESIGTSAGLSDAEAIADAADSAEPSGIDAAESFDRVRVPREGAGREALIADLRARQRAALLAPGSDADATPAGTVGRKTGNADEAMVGAVPARDRQAPAPTGTLPGEPPNLKRPQPRRRRHPLLWTLFVVLGVCLAAGALYYYGPSSIRNWRTPPAPVTVQQPTTAIPPVDSLTMVPLPFVIAVGAHEQLPDAEQRVESLNATAGARFFIAPLVREDQLFYHVFAGPLRDSTAAAAVLDTLLARGVKTGTTPGDLRQMPLSFLIGDHAREQDAREQVESLRDTGIPTFVVTGWLNGAERWRVYAGAYSGPAESDVMRQLLRGAGIKDSLVTRTGRSNQ